MERGIAAVRERYGWDVDMRINWLLMRPSCSVEALDAACEFAERHRVRIQVDLVHYSLPYFTEGPDRCLQFTPEDEPRLRAVVERAGGAQARPPRALQPDGRGAALDPRLAAARSRHAGALRQPPDALGRPDGTVQQCYVTFGLGNLHERRLRDLLYTEAHRQAARDSFLLNCPNCHCGYDTRVRKHGRRRRATGARGRRRAPRRRGRRDPGGAGRRGRAAGTR
jgi:cyclic pyranopterin phosphate synthase